MSSPGSPSSKSRRAPARTPADDSPKMFATASPKIAHPVTSNAGSGGVSFRSDSVPDPQLRSTLGSAIGRGGG